MQGQAPAGISAPAEVAQPELQFTDQQAVYQDFGPWQMSQIVAGSEQSSNAETLAWLHGDGSIESSTWSMPQDAAWNRTTAPFVTSLSSFGEVVQLEVNADETYVVFVGQPFILDGFSESVFMIDGHGDMLRLDTQTAMDLRVQEG